MAGILEMYTIPEPFFPNGELWNVRENLAGLIIPARQPVSKEELDVLPYLDRDPVTGSRVIAAVHLGAVGAHPHTVLSIVDLTPGQDRDHPERVAHRVDQSGNGAFKGLGYNTWFFPGTPNYALVQSNVDDLIVPTELTATLTKGNFGVAIPQMDTPVRALFAKPTTAEEGYTEIGRKTTWTPDAHLGRFALAPHFSPNGSVAIWFEPDGQITLTATPEQANTTYIELPATETKSRLAA